MNVSGVIAGYRAELALTDQAVAEIRVESKVVSPKVSGKLKSAGGTDMPDIVERGLGGVRLIALARVDGVVKSGHAEGDQTRHF